MNVQSLNPIIPTASNQSPPKEAVERARKPSTLQPAEAPDISKVQPEELLDKIKELTENGVYQVRFEMNNDVDKLVISVIDSDSGELVRQIPPEALLGMAEYLHDLRGNLVNSAS